MKIKRAVVAIYIDPDFFPPTINAILNLAASCQEVIVISRNNSTTNYPYPTNVHQKKIGKVCTVRDMEKQSMWLKAIHFLQFTVSLFWHVKNRKTKLVVLYDHFSVFAFYLVKKIRRNRKIWYHNHDMPDKGMIKKYSIGGLATKYEQWAMDYINFFSLPSKERIEYFHGIEKKIPVFIIPNYPSLRVYSKLKTHSERHELKIIFQGFIGPGHSLEEIIEILPHEIDGRPLQLILKGSVTDEYKKFLHSLAEKYNVVNKLTWVPIGPYHELPSLTSSCDIGIGINMNNDVISKTQGTASNKIYEYPACGLPVILFNSEQFRKYLDKYKWAFFTDGSAESLYKSIQVIVENLPALKIAARQSFEEELNFEKGFCPALKEIVNN